MQVQVKVDTRELENALYLLAREARVAPGQVIKEETGLLVRNIMQLTPPKNNAQGRKRIQGDLTRIVYPLDADKINWPPLKEAVRRRDIARIEALLRNKKAPNPTFTRDQGTMRAQHLKMRTKYGRINRGVKPILAALKADAAKYTRSIQARVGWAKSGFVAALNAAGKVAPNWIQRHASVSSRVVANFGENPGVHATAIDNKIPGFQRVVDNAVKNRERVTELKIKRLIAGRATNLGFVTILAKE